MEKFKHMPKEYWPDENSHVEYKEVYRGIKNIDTLSVDDFLPWNVEFKNRKKTFKNEFKQPEFGMSIFTDLDSLKKTVEKFPGLKNKTKGYAKGFTTIDRGISPKEDNKHHVDYYLYDYEHNSPKDDFEIIEVNK